MTVLIYDTNSNRDNPYKHLMFAVELANMCDNILVFSFCGAAVERKCSAKLKTASCLCSSIKGLE